MTEFCDISRLLKCNSNGSCRHWVGPIFREICEAFLGYPQQFFFSSLRGNRLATLRIIALQAAASHHPQLEPKTLLHLVEGRFQDFRKHSEKIYLLVLTEPRFQQSEASVLQTLNKFIHVIVDMNCLVGKLR